MQKRVNYDERAERARLIIELRTIASKWLEIDPPVASILLGVVSGLQAGVSRELALYLVDFTKTCLPEDKKKKLNLEIGLQRRFAEK